MDKNQERMALRALYFMNPEERLALYWWAEGKEQKEIRIIIDQSLAADPSIQTVQNRINAACKALTPVLELPLDEIRDNLPRLMCVFLNKAIDGKSGELIEEFVKATEAYTEPVTQPTPIIRPQLPRWVYYGMPVLALLFLFVGFRLAQIFLTPAGNPHPTARPSESTLPITGISTSISTSSPASSSPAAPVIPPTGPTSGSSQPTQVPTPTALSPATPLPTLIPLPPTPGIPLPFTPKVTDEGIYQILGLTPSQAVIDKSGGKLTLRQDIRIFIGDPQWTNYEVVVKLHQMYCPLGPAFTLGVRANVPGSMMALSGSSCGADWHEVVGGQFSAPLNSPSLEMGRSPDLTLDVIVSGNTFQVNGTQLIDLPGHPKGRIYLALSSGAQVESISLLPVD